VLLSVLSSLLTEKSLLETMSRPVDFGHGVSATLSFGSTADTFKAESDETGLIQWHAATLLGSLLAKTRAADGLDVVELGCGASLPSVVASLTGARSVLATDANASAVELGLTNIRSNAPAACLVDGRVLDWADTAATAVLAGTAEVVLTSEGLYVFHGGRSERREDGNSSSSIETQAYQLFSCASQLLKRGGNGVVLGVYSPRYRGMAACIAAGAARAGLEVVRVASSAVLSREQTATLLFGHTRLFVAAAPGPPGRGAAGAFLARHGLARGPGTESDSDSDGDERDGACSESGRGGCVRGPAGDLFD
jgi:hypothetical protein